MITVQVLQCGPTEAVDRQYAGTGTGTGTGTVLYLVPGTGNRTGYTIPV